MEISSANYAPQGQSSSKYNKFNVERRARSPRFSRVGVWGVQARQQPWIEVADHGPRESAVAGKRGAGRR